ncbi:MAG: putative hydroxymethylpyrimidine transporter CytX [Flexilinea sp.]
MTTITEKFRKVLPKVHSLPEWGIEPLPQQYRVFGFLDYFILWGDLGAGMLVLLTGSFLVPGLSLSDALLAILTGSVLGCLLLSIIGIFGSETAVPTMVLLRPVLGIRGSYLPSALNAFQLIGWTIFEFVIMGFAGDAIGKALFGVSNATLWIAIFAAIVILMGFSGPLGVVKKWLKNFAVWVVFVTTIWLTWHLLTTYNLTALFNKPGDGTLSFWSAVDLVIAMPISWLPLVADYTRFARNTKNAFWGTFLGNFITNAWFYMLGAVVLLAAGVSQEPKGFVNSIVFIAGWIALLILLVDETDNAWADLYSAAVSTQNIFPKMNQRRIILGLGIFSFLIAIIVDITQYENFLLLCGSLLIPLFGVLSADYFLLHRRKYRADEFYNTSGANSYPENINLLGLTAWITGTVIYNVTNPMTLGVFIPDWIAIVPTSFTTLGGSLPGFFSAFVTYSILAFLFSWYRQHKTAHIEGK